MSTPITTREDLTRIQWFAMSAYKNEKKAEEMLKGKDGLESVSYTHLDVYKRQAEVIAKGRNKMPVENKKELVERLLLPLARR